MNKSSNDDAVVGVLREWRVEPRRDPGFRPGVVERIGRGRETLGVFVRGHRVGVMVLVVALTVAGAWAGRSSARAYKDQAAFEYVRAQDARWMVLR